MGYHAPQRLAGRRAIITGGASGIGLATARRLLAEGAQVCVLDARPDGLSALADSAGGALTSAFRCDVGDEADVADAVARAAELMGGIDIVVSAAGITRGGDTEAISLDDWDLVIRVNLTGTFLVLKHSLPHLVAAVAQRTEQPRDDLAGNDLPAPTSAIVTIGSVASLVAAGRATSYDASKGGVLQLTRAVAVEYADRGIRANCVCPGLVGTGLAANSSALYGQSPRTTVEAPLSRIRVPMDRTADPSEMAGVISFLASDDASFVTGAAIAADGGYTAI